MSNDNVRALDIVSADFAGFTRVLQKVLTVELESFQGLSGQYGLYEDVDGVQSRLLLLSGHILSALEQLRDNGFEDSGLWAASRQVELLDSLLEQLDRYVTVADLRGATLTSGDLLKKLQGWVKTLREWLAGVRRQLAAIAGES